MTAAKTILIATLAAATAAAAAVPSANAFNLGQMHPVYSKQKFIPQKVKPPSPPYKHHPCYACGFGLGVGLGLATAAVIASSQSRHCWYEHRYVVDPLYGPTRVRFRVCE